MEVKKILLVFFCVFCVHVYAQVGINTTTPSAVLEIKSSNQNSPSNNDGLLIPKIDVFPTVNPTALQDGMLVYLTTTAGLNQPGFYYWSNNSNLWKSVAQSDVGSGWYKATTTLAPTSINEGVYRYGDVGIGVVNPSTKFEVTESDNLKTNSVFFSHTNPSSASNTNVVKTAISSNINLNGEITSLYNTVKSDNNVKANGITNSFTGNTSNSVFGYKNLFSNSGLGTRYGFYNEYLNAYGLKYGVYNNFSSTSGQNIGMYNEFSGNTAAITFGLFNKFMDVSTQNKKGIYNEFINDYTVNGINYGIHNSFDGVGFNNKYGLLNEISGNGDGEFYGVYNSVYNAGSGMHAGVRNYITGSGTGNKYGIINIIDTSAGGVHYGIYSTVLKNNSFAGYFLGKVAIGSTDTDKYVFPSIRGANGQIMITDASGNITWQSPSAIGWALTGNSGTNPATNFIGTIDNQDLVFKRNNFISGKISLTNTNFGFKSLLLNTGFHNAAFGNNTLENNTTGDYNVAIGALSLKTNTFGDSNIALGYSSLNKNTIGSYNNALGDRALFNNTTGNSNTALGFNAMFDNTTGSGNVAIGYSALVNNLSGLRNTVLGNQSHLSNTSGNNNVVIGADALYLNLTGNNNIALGYQAGYNELGSNKLYIENSSTIYPLIYGEFDSNIVRNNVDKFLINDPSINGVQMVLKNSNLYKHTADVNINFGNSGGDFLMATTEANDETSGIRGDGDNVSIWSPGDNDRLVRFLDEDNWSDNDGDPYNNGAEKAYIDSAGNFFNVSDKNKKQNINLFSNALNKINQINGYTYQYLQSKRDVLKNTKPVYSAGVIAQEVEKVLPEAVSVSKTGEYHVNYNALAPLYIESIKELNTKLEKQNELIKLLEKRISELENKK